MYSENAATRTAEELMSPPWRRFAMAFKSVHVACRFFLTWQWCSTKRWNSRTKKMPDPQAGSQ
ncbi:hypothetical protein D3C78_1888820 [compost metagenome]